MATWSTKAALQELQLGVTGDMTVVERLQYLLDTGQFADINIRVGQGNNVAVFKAHRLLLATASQPLYRLVQQVNPSLGPNDVSTLRITDMKPTDFESILKYIYTDHVECQNISVAFGLLRASRKWGLAGLGIKSLTYLEEFVDNFEPSTSDSKDNLFDLLVLSEDTLAELSAKCWQIVVKHGPQLIPCQGYLNLDKHMVTKVICHKDLKIENQLKLFEAIRDWGLNHLERQNLPLSSLGSVVEELIKVVDFEKITDSDFLSTVLTSECLGKAEVIAFFMTHGLEIPRKLDFNNNKQLPFWLTLCATTERDKSARVPGRSSKRPSSSSAAAAASSSLAPVTESLNNICSLTQNGSVLQFKKVCRFKKGYRCPHKEIYKEHELRFRVDKNVKLLGVGFGFLFTNTDMGLNVHCQGPWETRQWTDITQSYCRVSGEKQETADVRLMFLHPIKIEANQSYKVLVKMVRMNHGSSEVELWGGAGGVYCVDTEDAEFNFIKAAVDPDSPVQEADGDTQPGIITELLYLPDTDAPAQPTSARRRRPDPQPEEEVVSPVETKPKRQRPRPDSLKIPETPIRKRSPPSGSPKTPEEPPPTRRRERPPAEEYKPTSFSTNRWRTRPKEKEEVSPADVEKKKTPVEEYKPTSFSTNRWRTRPKEKEEVPSTDLEKRKTSTEEYKPSSFSTNRWRTRPKEETTTSTETIQTERKMSGTEDYLPSTFSTNRWRTRLREDTTNTTDTLAEKKKSLTDEYKPSSFSTNRWRTKSREEETNVVSPLKSSTEENRWKTKPQEDVKETPFGVMRRPSTRTDDISSGHPFLRRRDSKETTSDVPFFLRKTNENKPPTMPFGRSRWGTTTTSASTSSTSASTSTSKASGTPFQSRFLKSSDSTPTSLRSTASSTSVPFSSRYGSSRESSLTRTTRDSSMPRYGTSTSSYLSRYR